MAPARATGTQKGVITPAEIGQGFSAGKEKKTPKDAREKQTLGKQKDCHAPGAYFLTFTGKKKTGQGIGDRGSIYRRRISGGGVFFLYKNNIQQKFSTTGTQKGFLSKTGEDYDLTTH